MRDDVPGIGRVLCCLPDRRRGQWRRSAKLGLAEMQDELDDPSWDERSWQAIRSQADYVEFDWFALDAAGHLAVLSSFGVGPSPSVVRASRERFNAALAKLASLPEDRAALVEPDCAYKYTESWQTYARRGLFGYDNAGVHAPEKRRYERIVRPSTPLTFDEMSDFADALAWLPRLSVLFEYSPSNDFCLVPP